MQGLCNVSDVAHDIQMVYPERISLLLTVTAWGITLLIQFNRLGKEERSVYTIFFLIAIINVLLSMMWLHVRGTCILSSIFAFPSVWILGMMGPQRMNVIIGLWDIWHDYKCDHGISLNYPVTGVICSFIGDIYECLLQSRTYIQDDNTLDFQNAATIFLEIVERLADRGTLAKLGADKRNEISSILLRLGTNLLLGVGEDVKGPYGIVVLYAMFISMFEKVPLNGTMTAKEIMTIARGVSEMSQRGIIKFYSKRISCSCLEKIYKSFEKGSKQVRCHKCRLVKRPKELFWCTGCMTRQYCCKGCQRKDWEGGHKDCCNDVSALLTRSLIVGRNECSG